MLIFADVKHLRVTVSVSNDLLTDQRVNKVCNSLKTFGYDVKLIGRILPKSKAIERPYVTKRFRLWFNKGPLFYANLNLALFLHLIFSRTDILLSNDLDTLPANFLASKVRGFHLVYDSHELFSEVPELMDRPKTQKVWRSLESFLLPRLKYCYTVSSHIKEHYNHLYSSNFKVIRNFPRKNTQSGKKEKFILYQGALNIGRGIEDVIHAMPFISNYKLYIAGSGDIEAELKEIVLRLKLTERVIFLGRLAPEELKQYTLKASLGFSLEKDLGLNYRYAVPNKIFDYIQCEVPILYSPLIEVVELLKPFHVGEVLHSREPQKLASQILGMLHSASYDEWVSGCQMAKERFNWSSEEEKLKAIFDAIE